jgi:hypothetical protein
MLALRKFETVDSSGKVQIDIPQEFGSKVEILILPVHDNVDLLDTSVDAYFFEQCI